MTTLFFRPLTAALLPALLFMGNIANGAPTPTNTYFGTYPEPTGSLYDRNVAFTAWLIGGLEQIGNVLHRLAESPRLTPADLDQFRQTIRADATRLENSNGPAKELTQIANLAADQMLASKKLIFDAPDDYSRKMAEQNQVALPAEIALANTANEQVEIYGRRLNELASTADAWKTFWTVTESARGLDQARKQVAELVAKERDQWIGLKRREIAETLLARKHRIPDGLPPGLQMAFRKMDQQLPRFQQAPDITPNPLHPLLEPEGTNGVSILLTTTHAASPEIRVTGPDGDVTNLNAIEVQPQNYRATWHPPFLADGSWRSRTRKTGRAQLGTWRFTIELRSQPAETGAELLTASTNLTLRVLAEAAGGLALEQPPKPSRFLQKYPREEDIPLESKHHALAILAYPLLGLPRDLLDAVFGAIDKVPYLSMPISLLYAAPGQLLCKPWWDEDYRPFSQQSAGYYAWIGMDNDEWQYLENARTWYSPKSEDLALLSFAVYLGLGLPRDIVDAVFGAVDQIPVISAPISYLYAPLTLATKPWYADQYISGDTKGQERVPYCRQSRHVICPEDWQSRSGWIFFENFKTTAFRSPDTAEQTSRQQRYRREMAAYQEALRATASQNDVIRNSCTITLLPAENEVSGDDHVTR